MGEHNMDISLQKRLGWRPRAVLVGLGVLGCCLLASLVHANVSSANVPEKGNNCVEVGGKISGRGSTLQEVLQAFQAKAYRDDYCGATGPTPTQLEEEEKHGEAFNTMVAYDYPSAEAATKGTGSGAGLKAALCRTDAFAGTDTPYTKANLEEIDGVVPANGGACSITFDPPFAPQVTPNGGNYEYPGNSEDIQANVMSFPIAGSAVAIAANLTGACTNGTPTSLEFNAQEVSRIFGGDAKNWDESELESNNPQLGTDDCTGEINRIVREDSSGTTNIFKEYLINADNNRTGTITCDSGKKWSEYLTTNTEWPGKPPEPTTGCTPIKQPAKSGNPEVLALIHATNSSIGYADLPQEVEANTGLVTASVESAAMTGSYQTPQKATGSNCNYNSLTLPGLSASEAVGLNVNESWANNNPVNHGNPTDLGTAYPICGLTWDLVFKGLHEPFGNKSAIAGLSNNQRRTLYSYMTFLLSSTAQDLLSNHYYAPLPNGWLQTLTQGFQNNF
jgi:ABC-type phosphate transport system substrate-binding protein